MGSELEQKVEERIREAKLKGYMEKASLITEILGTKSEERRGHVYQAGTEWEISHLCYSSWSGLYEEHLHNWHAIVKYEQEEVFNAKHYDRNKEETINVYLPGEWEEELDELYNTAIKEKGNRERRAKRKRLREERKEEREREEDLMKRFGL